MHRPRSRERRQRFPPRRHPEAGRPEPSGIVAEQHSPVDQEDGVRHSPPGHMLQQPQTSPPSGYQPAHSHPPPQVIKIPMRKLRDFQIQHAIGTITQEQTMGMLTEIPWEQLLLPPKPTLPPFRELHPEPPGKENEAGLYKPRPFDPERNDYGSAKLIPWRNCARARQWIKKRYNRKFWYYDMEHVKWKTLCENFERELKRMHKEPNFVEIKQLEKYQKKTEKAAELLMEEALKAVVRMKEEEAERKRQEEEQEEQERRKYQYTLLSASELWEVKEATKLHLQEYLNIQKHTKQQSSNRTAGYLKNFRMARATDNYNEEMPLAAPPMQMRIKSSNVVLSHEVTALSNLETVDWDSIWFEDKEPEEVIDPEECVEGIDVVMEEYPSEANTSPREDLLSPGADSDGRQRTISPAETEVDFEQLTWEEKMDSMMRRYNPEYDQDPPASAASAPASFGRKQQMEVRRMALAELSQQPLLTRDRAAGYQTQIPVQRAPGVPKEHRRKTNTPVTESQILEATFSRVVINQIETPRKKNKEKEERPAHIREHHWKAMLRLKEMKEQEAAVDLPEETERPQIPAIIPNLGQQEYVRNCVALYNYQAEQMTAALPQYPITDSQATSPAIMEEEQLDDITNDFIGELRDEIAAETMDEMREEPVRETESEPAHEKVPESVEEPVEDPFMEEFVEIFSPPRDRSPMSSPRPLTPPAAVSASPAPLAPVSAPPPAVPQIFPPVPPIQTPAPRQAKKFLVWDPKTQQLIPSSGAVIMKASPPGPSAPAHRNSPPVVEQPLEAIPQKAAPVSKEPVPVAAVPKNVTPQRAAPSPGQPASQEPPRPTTKNESSNTKLNAGTVTQRIADEDMPQVKAKRRGRPPKAESAKRRREAQAPAGPISIEETGPSSSASRVISQAAYSPKRIPLKMRILRGNFEIVEAVEEPRELPPKIRNTRRSKETEQQGTPQSRLEIATEEVFEPPAKMTRRGSGKVSTVSPSIDRIITRKGREAPATSSGTTTDSEGPRKKSRRQRIREKQEAVKQDAREKAAHKLAVQKEAFSLAQEIMAKCAAKGKLQQSRESTVSGSDSQQVSPLPVETNPTPNLGEHRVSPVEIERAYREISNPVETEFGTVFTSPRSQIPLESRFATDLAMAHPKSRTRRQAAIRRAEEEAQREAASKAGTSVLPATPPNVIQIGTVDHSRESSILEEIGSESSSVYLAGAQQEAASKSGTSVLPATLPNVIQIGTVDHSRESSILEEIEPESSSVYLARAQQEATSRTETLQAPSPNIIEIDTVGSSRGSSVLEEISSSERFPHRVHPSQQQGQEQQQEEEPSPDEVQIIPRSSPKESSPEISIIEAPEKSLQQIKQEQLDALDQAAAVIPPMTDREYDEDGVDEDPPGYPLICAYDFTKIDGGEITTDMLPFPPEVVRVDGECFTHLLYNLVRGEMHTHLPRLTYRYSRYSTDLLMFFASVSPRYLDETNLKLALEKPERLADCALNSLSPEAMLLLTLEKDITARKKQLVTSNKIKGIMGLFLDSRKTLLKELGITVYGKTEGPQYDQLKEQFDAAMNNIQIAICDNLMGLAEETKDWKPSENVLKRRFEAFLFGWRGFILRGGPLKCYSNMFQNNGMAEEVHNTLEVWFTRLDCLLDAITHDLRKEPIARATDLVRLFEGNTRCSVQWEASLADVHNEPSEIHCFGCEECAVWFSNPEFHEKHEQLHDYKPYGCSVEGLGFSHQVSLHLHYLHRHMKEVLNGELTVPPVANFP